MIAILISEHALDFKCSMCGGCCSSWKIVIDDKTVKEYRSMINKDKFLQKYLFFTYHNNEHYLLLEHPNPVFNLIRYLYEIFKCRISKEFEYFLPSLSKKYYFLGYHIMNFIDRKNIFKEFDLLCTRCNMLGNDNYCYIHKKYGSEYLSDICKTYPRAFVSVNDELQVSMSYSCPTAAQLLRSKNKLKYINLSKGLDEFIPNARFEVKIDSDYKELEKIAINIVQDRSKDLSARFKAYSLAIKLYDLEYSYSNEPWGKHLTEDLECFNEKLNKSFPKIQSIKFDPLKMLGFLKITLQMIGLIRFGQSKEFKFFQHIIYNLNTLFDDDLDEIKASIFEDAYLEYYLPYENNISHIFENYITNIIFFKHKNGMSHRDKFIEVSFIYTLARFLIINYCMYNKQNVSEDIVIISIIGIDKFYRHNFDLKKDIFELITELGYDIDDLMTFY